MLIEKNFNLFLIPLFGLLLLITLIARWKVNKDVNPIRKAFNSFKVTTIAVACFSALLWLLLPHTPVLSTFGRPDDITSLKDVLRYLQEYNDALVRTIQVVQWFIFIFVWWFLVALYEFSKAMVEVENKGTTESTRLD